MHFHASCSFLVPPCLIYRRNKVPFIGYLHCGRDRDPRFKKISSPFSLFHFDPPIPFLPIRSLFRIYIDRVSMKFVVVYLFYSTSLTVNSIKNLGRKRFTVNCLNSLNIKVGLSLQVRGGAWKTAGVIGFRACRYAEALIAAADRTIISSSPIPSLPLFSSLPVAGCSRTVTAIDKSPCRSQTSLQTFLLLPSVSVDFVFFSPPSLSFLPSFLPSFP